MQGLKPSPASEMLAAMGTGTDPPTGALDGLADRLDRLSSAIERLEAEIERLSAAVERIEPAAATAAQPAPPAQHAHHLPHPVRSAEHELEHLNEVADEGESGATPAILIGGLLAILIPIVALGIAAAIIAPILATRGGGSSTASPWTLPNGDLANTRVVHGSPITSANVSTARCRVDDAADGEQHLRDVRRQPGDELGRRRLPAGSRLERLRRRPRDGPVLWRRTYNSQDIGPNGVTYVGRRGLRRDGQVRLRARREDGQGALAQHDARAAASLQKGGGELASGFGIDIQPQVANGTVYLSSAALLGGGIVYALDAKTGKTLWSFDSVIDPVGKKIIGGGAWNAPAIGPDGTVYFGFGNMYQPALGRRLASRAGGSTPTARSRSTARPGS